jgi:hypothetical protein
MTLIRSDQDDDGKMNDFDSFMLPHDPVANKRSSDHKCPAAEISKVTFASPLEDVTKACVGRTGVEYRFHTKPEYYALSEEQRKDLNQYRDAREAQGLSHKLPKTKGRGGATSPHGRNKDVKHNGNKKMKTMIAAAVSDALKSSSAKAENDAAVKQLQEYIAALVDSAKKPTGRAATTPPVQASSTTAAPPAVSLNTTLGRIKK